MTEQQPYEVLEQHDRFELRHYPPHLVAEVEIAGSFEDAGNRAFRSLFRYITGNNRAQQSIEMTAPVVQEEAASEKVAMTAPVVQAESADGGYVVAFVLPGSMTLDTAPVPADPAVQVRAVPERLAAAMRYSGRWSQASYERHRSELLDAVVAAGFTPTGVPRFARFDPPFKPWFLRRNEVVQDVDPGVGLAPGLRVGSSWGMAEVSPLPIRGEVVVDARGGSPGAAGLLAPRTGRGRAVDLARQHLRRDRPGRPRRGAAPRRRPGARTRRLRSIPRTRSRTPADRLMTGSALGEG